MLAFRCRFQDRVDQDRRQPAALFWRILLEIDRRDGRQFRAGIAARQNEVPIAPGTRIHMALDGWRRRGQDHRALPQAATHHSHVAALVMHAVILLVALVMFFIEHDQAQLAERQEQC